MTSFHSAPTVSEAPLPSIGNLQLIKYLGKGGFGETFLARNIYSSTIVRAVKLPRAEYILMGGREIFATEARVVSELDHANILPLIDYGILDVRPGLQLPYLVMPFMENGSLKDRHKDGEKVDLQTVISYVNQVAAALQYAHDHRIVHRDVNPSN